MRSTLNLLTVACLAVTSGLFVANTFGETTVVTDSKTTVTTPSADAHADAMLPQGVEAKNLNDDKAIEKAFKGVTEDGVSKNSFGSLVGYLADQDKARIKKSTDKKLSNMDGQDNKSLNDVLASLGGAWESKYNTKFKIDYKQVFNSSSLQISTGIVNDPDGLVGHWPVPVRARASTAGSVTSGDAQIAKDKMFGGNVNLEKGREVAIAHLNAGNGLSGITASMIHETLTGWTFDIPNTIDADRLYNNLVNNLSFLNNNRDVLSPDVNQAYSQVANAVISAMYDIDISQAGNRNPTAMAR